MPSMLLFYQNRLTRSAALREILIATASNDALRIEQMKNWGLEGYYGSLVSEV